MANSFSFNGVDMSAYGLRVRSHNLDDAALETETVQLRDRAYGLGSVRTGLEIVLDVVISAASYAALCTALDNIKLAVNQRADCALKVDSKTDRYWLARTGRLQRAANTATTWQGTITFQRHDPLAYATSETSSDHTVDEDPEVISKTVTGTANTRPVFTLVADDTLTDTTVSIENEATGETIEWTGSLVATDVLVIDCVNYLITLNGAADMVSVAGPFPEFIPGSNIINVAGFSGSLNIAYTPRYT